MARFKDVAIGVLAGALIGGGVAAANGTFENVKGFSKSSRSYQLGYTAGVADAVSSIVEQHYSDNSLREAGKCFGSFSNLGKLTDWAVRRMSDPQNAERKYSASSVLIVDGTESCDQ